ncbi:serine/threonine-protein kinase [Acetivibrio cellulolyticus]|uniref:serine/threonine-protein kinase n=1 Tax=Acetivibrio cellulolyticus TaxID=35830 RepID=UPI0001E2C712|nr:serine/threonine-protein kinase [Acetivibrio cellulolyticus]
MVGEIIKQKYKIERLLGKGASGEVYLCRNIELGNLWAVKRIEKSKSKYELTTETNILKKLNHISLPKIADVMEDETGIYIVESYIEGTPLNKLLEAQGTLSEERVVSLAKQLCEVLLYLHNLKPFPIIYRDLKPHNIIITSDNRPVLIDFGISREYKGSDRKDTVIAGTPHYAAPEQLTAEGISDVRADIYSLGVTLHHLLTGVLPKYDDTSLIQYNNKISRNMDYIVRKCIRKDLKDRYQTVEELLTDLKNINRVRVLDVKLRKMNRVLITSMVILSMISFSTVYLGISAIYKENAALLLLSPQILSLSVNQTGIIKVLKEYPDGSKEELKASDIKWNYPSSEVAKISNDEIQPLKEGKAQFDGSYNGKPIKLTVVVNEPLDDTKDVNINLKYLKDTNVTLFAGVGQHADISDGNSNTAVVNYPKSLSINKVTNDTYFTDSAKLRAIKDGWVKTLGIELDNYKDIDLVKIASSGNIYFSIAPYINEKEQYVSEIYILQGNKPKLIYQNTESTYNISDFAFDSSENMYILQPKTIGLDAETTFTLVDRLSGSISSRDIGSAESITVDGNNNIFISSSTNGTILKLDQTDGRFKNFAGKEMDKNFIDGTQCSFFSPEKIVADGNYIYVIDSNVLRRIVLENGKLVDVETLAGKVGKGQQNLTSSLGYNAWFAKPSDLAIDAAGNILLTDSDNSVIWEIKLPADK